MSKVIVKFQNTLDKDQWNQVLLDIAEGFEILIARGAEEELVKYADGNVALKVKLGKKKKLARGYIKFDYKDSVKEVWFTPNKRKI
jgi:hypothetical protein